MTAMITTAMKMLPAGGCTSKCSACWKMLLKCMFQYCIMTVVNIIDPRYSFFRKCQLLSCVAGSMVGASAKS